MTIAAAMVKTLMVVLMGFMAVRPYGRPIWEQRKA
jgi:hypothetical protein